jgi:hypothetical protein
MWEILHSLNAETLMKTVNEYFKSNFISMTIQNQNTKSTI